jgi:hypothetical protein
MWPVRLQDDLLKRLEQKGWMVTRRKEEPDYRAWYHEIWAIESRQSPEGLTLFLTFLTDPQPGNPNPFWVIGTSRELPENSSEASGEPTLTVTPNWINDLPRFVDRLNARRQAAADNADPISKESQPPASEGTAPGEKPINRPGI